jgi:RNA polymerase sigma-70 factor (ECF subfamily)
MRGRTPHKYFKSLLLLGKSRRPRGVDSGMSEPANHTLRVQQLFVRHQSALKAFVLALCPDFAEADDIMQDVFLVITQKANQLDHESHFLTWARTVARFEVLTSRKKMKHTGISDDAMSALQASCPETFAEDRKLEALTRCLEKVAPKARELLTLRYLQGQSPEQISKLLSRTANSVNVALAKTRAALRECLDLQLGRTDAR